MGLTSLDISILNGTARSHPTGSPFTVAFENTLPTPINIYAIDASGKAALATSLAPYGADGWDKSVSNCQAGVIYYFTSGISGAYGYAITLSSEDAIVCYKPVYLTPPNNIGGFPQPSKAMPIPTDSPRILVGSGTLTNGNLLTREQFWRRDSQSYSLAPLETHTVSYTETSGLEQTTSDSETVSQAFGSSVSLGWGPISTSLSASLSQSSTHFQQTTIKTQTTRYMSMKMRNLRKFPQMFLKWQLMDVYNICDASSYAVLATIEQGENPILVEGYDIDDWAPIRHTGNE